MRKLLLILFAAVLMVPTLQSCNSDYDHAELSALLTIKKDLNNYGWYGLMDNGERLYPSNVRLSYNAGNEDKRAIVYFSLLEEPVSGYTHNADVFNVVDILTKDVDVLTEAAADTLGNHATNITNAWISGGYLNIEFQVKVDPYNTNQRLLVSVVDNQVNGEDKSGESYYPLEFRFKCTPAIEDDGGTLISSMACFRLDELDPSFTGGEGIKLIFDSFNFTQAEKLVKPLTNQTLGL